MIEIVDGKIYRVKNFAKHQNIKVEEKAKSEVKEINFPNIEAAKEEVIINETCVKEEKKSDMEKEDKEKESKNNVVENHRNTSINENKRGVEINKIRINKDNALREEISSNTSQNCITTIPLEHKKNKKIIGKKSKEEVDNLTDEEVEEEEIFCFREGEYIPGEGEKIIASWTF